MNRFYKFTVNENYAVRFGMGAIKGVGEGAVNTIVECRKDGKYKSIFDLAKRIDLRAANKKAFENLALAGGFDGFTNTHRAQYFHHDGDNITFLEKAIRYGSKSQENENSSQVSLFGEASDAANTGTCQCLLVKNGIPWRNWLVKKRWWGSTFLDILSTTTDSK